MELMIGRCGLVGRDCIEPRIGRCGMVGRACMVRPDPATNPVTISVQDWIIALISAADLMVVGPSVAVVLVAILSLGRCMFISVNRLSHRLRGPIVLPALVACTSRWMFALLVWAMFRYFMARFRAFVSRS